MYEFTRVAEVGMDDGLILGLGLAICIVFLKLNVRRLERRMDRMEMRA